MFRITCLIYVFLSWGIVLNAQDIILKGQVSIHNSKYKTGTIQYVPYANIRASFASPGMTDNKGEFSILFRGLARGSETEVIVEKEGLEVVNARALQEVVIPRRESLRVFMAPKNQLIQAQTELYNINLRAITDRYDNYIKQLKKDQTATIAELEMNFGREINNSQEAIALLTAELENTKRLLPGFASKLARVNLDYADESYRKAYEAFGRGELDIVIELLDSNAVDPTAELEELDRLSQQLEQVTSSISTNYGLLERKMDNIELKTNSYLLRFQFRTALNTYWKKFDILERFPDREESFMVSGDQISKIYRSLGKYDSAKLYQLKSIDLKKKHHANHPSLSLAESYDHLALILLDLGERDSAFHYQQKAIHIKSSIPCPAPLSLATSYDQLSNIYFRFSAHDSGLIYLRKSLAIRQKELPPQDRNVSGSYHNLAAHYYIKENYDSALHYQLKAVSIDEQRLNPYHPDLATSFNLLSLIYQKHNEYTLAIFYQTNTLRIRAQIYEAYHPYLASTYNNIGNLYRDMGSFNRDIGKSDLANSYYDSAILYQRKALPIYERSFSKFHPEKANAYHNLALMYRNLQKPDSSIIWEHKALEIRKKSNASLYPEFASSYNNLSLSYFVLGKRDSTLHYTRKLLEARRSVLEPSHKLLGTAHHNLASIYKGMREYDSAYIHMQKSVDIRKIALSPLDSTLKKTYEQLALIQYFWGDFDGGTESQHNCLRIFEQLPKCNNQELAIHLKFLGILYREAGKLDSAQIFVEKSIHLNEQMLQNADSSTNQISLGISYLSKAKILDQLQQDEEMIQYAKRAMELLPSSHPQYSVAEEIEKKACRSIALKHWLKIYMETSGLPLQGIKEKDSR